MIVQRKVLVAGATLAGALGSSLPATTPIVHAAVTVVQNSCAAPLPVDLVFGSGILTTSTLRGGGYTARLTQFGGPGLLPEVKMAGIHPLSGDAPAEFTFMLPNGGNRYDGIVHVFQNGAVQQVCYLGAFYVNGDNSAALINHPRTTIVRLNGTMRGGRARIDFSVGYAHYYVFGPVRKS